MPNDLDYVGIDRLSPTSKFVDLVPGHPNEKSCTNVERKMKMELVHRQNGPRVQTSSLDSAPGQTTGSRESIYVRYRRLRFARNTMDSPFCAQTHGDACTQICTHRVFASVNDCLHEGLHAFEDEGTLVSVGFLRESRHTLRTRALSDPK